MFSAFLSPAGSKKLASESIVVVYGSPKCQQRLISRRVGKTHSMPSQQLKGLTIRPQKLDKSSLAGSTLGEGVPDRRYLRQRRFPTADFLHSIRTVDMFSGAGSLTLGVWEACRRLGLGVSPIAIDINRYALSVYLRNFPHASAIAQDVTSMVDGKLHTAPTLNEMRFAKSMGSISMLLSGSPCQGFCPLNNYTRGRDHRNSLYLRAARVVEICRPENLLFENVPDVVNGDADVVASTLDVLRERGYHFDAGTFDLAEIGVPQHRKRHVVVASLEKHVSIQETISKFKVRRVRTVRWAIEDLKSEAPHGIFDSPSKQSPANRLRIKYLYRRGAHDLPNSLRPRCQKERTHRYKSMYGRIWYDLPAQTITSGFGSPGQGRFVHPTRKRTLTPHEAARLQFFPDFYDFSSVQKRTVVAELIGNAAPMVLSLVFTLELLS